MSPGKGVLSLLLAVATLSALMLAASRLAGRVLGPRAGRAVDRAEPGAPEDAGTGGATAAFTGASDLSFYSTLGPARPGTGAPATPPVQGAAVPGRPEAPPGGAYVVQALATRDGAAARRLRDRLAARGLPAVLVEGTAAGEAVYRVRVGRYRDREVAESMARRLRDQHRLTPWVLREED
jgi:cell division septation protein DedD